MTRSPDVAASTYNKDVEVLQGVFKYAIKQGLILFNPADSLKKRKQPKVHIVIPSKDQFRLLVETLLKKDSRYWQAADFVQLLAYSGMRLGEATQLKWNEVDFARESFVVTGGEQGTKNHEDRTVPLFPALRRFLEKLKAQLPAIPADDALVMPATKATKALRTVCKEAKLPKFTHHALRHYFVSNAIEAGVDFKTIAAWVGHKDGGILVAETYGHLRDIHSQEMAKRMTFAVEVAPVGTPAPASKPSAA